MVNVKPKIVWDNVAKEYLKRSLQHIKNDSLQNAETVKNDIRTVIREIPSHPYRYPVDKYCISNDSRYRALTIYNFRISYFVGNSEIRIVRIRHSKQEPLDY